MPHKDPDKRKEYFRAYRKRKRLEDPEKFREYFKLKRREWVKKNPERVKAQLAKSREDHVKAAIKGARHKKFTDTPGDYSLDPNSVSEYPKDGLCQNPHCRRSNGRTRLCCDHDHCLSSENFRGWFCSQCNMILSKDSNLERHKWLIDMTERKRFYAITAEHIRGKCT